MLAGLDFFNQHYKRINGELTIWFPDDREKEAIEVKQVVETALLKLSEYFKIEIPEKLGLLFVTEHDWSKTPRHDQFPYGLSYQANSGHPTVIYLSESLPEFNLMADPFITRKIIIWHELAKLFFLYPHINFPQKAPHWLKEGLPQLAVWTLLKDLKIDCESIKPIEEKLRDQTHFTILEYKISTPVKPARYIKYQWLLLFMMRDLSLQHEKQNHRHLLNDMIEAIKKAPRRMDYQKSMEFLNTLLKMNVCDWLSTRWYF